MPENYNSNNPKWIYILFFLLLLCNIGYVFFRLGQLSNKNVNTLSQLQPFISEKDPVKPPPKTKIFEPLKSENIEIKKTQQNYNWRKNLIVPQKQQKVNYYRKPRRSKTFYQKSKTKNIIRIATCFFTPCIQNYYHFLEQHRVSYKTKKEFEPYTVFELVSYNIYSEAEAKQRADQINQYNQMVGVATAFPDHNGYRITLGFFPDGEFASKLKYYLETLQPLRGLRLHMRSIHKKYKTTVIYLGPYSKRSILKQTLKKLKRYSYFKGAYITSE